MHGEAQTSEFSYQLYFQHNNLSENFHLKIKLLRDMIFALKLTLSPKVSAKPDDPCYPAFENVPSSILCALTEKQHLAFGTNLFTFDQ